MVAFVREKPMVHQGGCQLFTLPTYLSSSDLMLAMIDHGKTTVSVVDVHCDPSQIRQSGLG